MTAAVAVVAGVVAVVVTPHDRSSDVAEAPSASPTASYESHLDHRERLASAMLKRRLAALKSGDEAAWLADVDPSAIGVLAREKARFTNLRLLNPTAFDLVMNSVTGVPDGQDSADGVGTVYVVEVLKLPGDVEFSKEQDDYRVDFEGEKATIGNITPTATVAGQDDVVPSPPWDDVTLRSASGDGVNVLAAADGKWNPATYLPAAERARTLVRSIWGNRTGSSNFTVFLADGKQFDTWFSNTNGSKNFAGLTYFAPMVEADGRGRFDRPNLKKTSQQMNQPSWLERSAGGRIVLNMPVIDSVAYAQEVLAHEMGHAIGPYLIGNHQSDSGAEDLGLQPTWPIEGFARWIEYVQDPAYAASAMREVRAGRAKYHLNSPFPASKGFYQPDPDRLSFNYNLSASMYLAAAEVGGRTKTVDLYVCLSNTMGLTSDTEMFINVCLEGVGLDPDKIWAAQHRLAG